MIKKETKFIFVTGGVVSSLGKGIVASSLGFLLKKQGYSVTIQKFDPYLNIDPGTMSPYQHGEVFVTEDGCETDLDLGHYERFIDQNLCRSNNVTSGMIFWDVLNQEREGKFLGNTVQIIPHITNEIKSRIKQTLIDNHFDFVITEVGGTVGDIESLPFLEAIRQFEFQNKSLCSHIHVTLLPYLKTSGEFKTKPTQHSVKDLRQIGIHPDVIVCRSEKTFPKDINNKIALFCDVKPEAVIACPDANSIYQLPLHFNKQGLSKVILKQLSLPYDNDIKLSHLDTFTKILEDATIPKTSIAIVGKYTQLSDAYISIVESLKHASVSCNRHLNIKWIDSETISSDSLKDIFKDINGILIPGGFGDRGIDGKLLATQYARENQIPYFGICLGLHIAVIEFARNVLHLTKANSIEFNPKTTFPVIHILSDQKSTQKKGGTMRLGAYPCHVQKNTKLFDIYNIESISERHRHRYEFNMKFADSFKEKGVVFSGLSPDTKLVEAIEIPSHPFFLACQFHPEFKSRPQKPHPLFKAFIQAC